MGVLNQEISPELFRKLFLRGGAKAKKETSLKTTINFVAEQQRETNWLLAIPGVILIVIAAALFAKLCVMDRYERLAKEQGALIAMQDRYDIAMDYLNGSEEVADWFEHYSWTLMSADELNRIPRTEVAKLVEQMGGEGVSVRAYSLSGNELSVEVTSPNLQTVSRLSEKLRTEDIVSACTVNTARTLSGTIIENGVDARMTIRIRTREELRERSGSTKETEEQQE